MEKGTNIIYVTIMRTVMFITFIAAEILYDFVYLYTKMLKFKGNEGAVFLENCERSNVKKNGFIMRPTLIILD